MKHTFVPVLLALVASAALAQNPASPAPSQPAASSQAPNKVGIIFLQRAIVATNEGQRDFQELQKKFEPKQAELRTLNQEIEDLKKQLSNQSDKLNEQTRAELVRNIEQKQKSLQRSFEDAQTEFQGDQQEVATRIGEKLMKVLDEYANKNGYAIILDVSNPQSGVLWAGQAVDVTDEVVAAYNAQSNVPPPATPASNGTPSAPSATRPPGR